MTILTLSRHFRFALKLADYARLVRMLDEPAQTKVRRAVVVTSAALKKAETTTCEIGDKAQTVVAAVVATAVDVIGTVVTLVKTVRTAVTLIRGLFAAV